MKQTPRFSETEWEVMKIIWAQAPCTAGQIIELLIHADPTWHPKTVKAFLNRLVKKQVLGFRKEGRAYLYRPLVRESECVDAVSESFLTRAAPSTSGRAKKQILISSTGNHVATPDDVRAVVRVYEKLLAPSEHLLRTYLEAGLSPQLGAVVPHGIDPAVFSPQSPPFRYPTWKGFKFLQTSMPVVYDKGFDLTLKAFGRAFSNHDDAALILRVPRIDAPGSRKRTFDRLQQLVSEEVARPGAPEILLVELDVEPDRRGGIFTGADCYVHPARCEGFGITILEAMACGLPVIATAWNGPADFLSPRWAYTLRHSNPVAEKSSSDSIRAYHVEPDLDHLIYLMRYAYDHREEGKALGQKAARAAREHWTWKHAARKLASLFSLPIPPPEMEATCHLVASR